VTSAAGTKGAWSASPRAPLRPCTRHAGSLSHPGIARVYDYREADPPCLVMELVDGPSLARLLEDGPLDPARAMGLIGQAARALAAAHAAGLVHRGIKRGNVLVGPGGQVKITDFGIAHAAGSAALTRPGALLGTPAYLAPERAAGGPGTPAADLYALGIVAYQCLTGRLPFEGEPLAVALAQMAAAAAAAAAAGAWRGCRAGRRPDGQGPPGPARPPGPAAPRRPGAARPPGPAPQSRPGAARPPEAAPWCRARARARRPAPERPGRT
jgi:eukaryotic-like serine/threonine-protein kinase